MSKTIRIIKLQPEYRQRKYERRPHIVPSLKLSGNWLTAAGFFPSKLVHVSVENNQLIITSVEP